MTDTLTLDRKHTALLIMDYLSARKTPALVGMGIQGRSFSSDPRPDAERSFLSEHLNGGRNDSFVGALNKEYGESVVGRWNKK